MANDVSTAQSRYRLRSFEFAVVATDSRGLGADDIDTVADILFEAGCDDATPSFQNGVFVIDFDRRARNLIQAIASAIKDVRAAGLRVLRVEPDEIVSASEVARRLGVSRQAVSKWFREYDGAPAPVLNASTDTPMYEWTAILKWLRRYRRERISVDRIIAGDIVKLFNNSLKPSQRRPALASLGVHAEPAADSPGRA